MKNRMIAWLLAVMLVAGLVPTAVAESAADPELPQIKALLSEDTVTVDGSLMEDVWAKGQLASKLTASGDAVSGTLYHLYQYGILYVGGDYAGATAMTLTIAGKTWNFALNSVIATDDGVVTGAAANGVLELAVKLNLAGIYLQNFNTTLPYEAVLSDGTNTAALTAELLFSGDYVDGKLNELDKSGTVEHISVQTDGSYVFTNENSGTMIYTNAPGEVSELNWAKGVVTEFAMRVDAMTDDHTGAINDLSGGGNQGVTILLGSILGEEKAYGTVGLIWYNSQSEELCLSVKTTGETVQLPLGVALKEAFTLAFRWNTDNSLTVLLNGAEKAVVSDAKVYTGSISGKTLIRVYTQGTHNLTISDISFTACGANTDAAVDITDGKKKEVLPPDKVDTDSSLKKLVSNSKLGQVPMRWEATGDGVGLISADGKVTRPMDADKTFVLKGYPGTGTTAIVEKTVTVSQFAPMPFYTINAALNSSLGLNFFVDKDQVDRYADAGAYALIICSRDGAEIRVERENWKTDPDGGYYKFTYTDIAAKEMDKLVTVQLFMADGTPITVVKDEHVKSYTERLLNSQTDETLLRLLVDMLNYGSAAQTYFAYGTEKLANSGLTDAQKALATQEPAAATDCRQAGENYYGTSLSLEDKIVLNFYFRGEAEGKTARVTYTDHYGKPVEKELPVVQNGSFLQVAVDCLAIADAGQLVTVEILEGETVYGSAADSVESYCSRMQNSEVGDLCQALLKFAASARLYFAQA